MFERRARSLQRAALLGLVLLEVTSLVLGGATGAAHAQTTTIGCGATVVTSVMLKSDLVDCPTHGLIVGADNVTIDLNGHTIDGSGIFDEWNGVDNSAGHDGVTIVNGRMQDFRNGVYLYGGATGNRVADLILTADYYGIGVVNSLDNSIETSRFVRNFGAGIAVQDSVGTLISNNVLSNRRASAQVLVFRSNDTLIEGNDMQGGHAAGVESVLGSNNDVIGNVFSGGGKTEIGIFTDTPGSRIAKNEVSGFYPLAAVFVGADRIRVEKNLIHDSAVGVILQGSFFGRPIGVVVRRNEVFNTDIGFRVREMTDTLVERNFTHDNRIGIFVEDSTGTLLLKNRSDQNDEDGISILDPATTVTHNRADLNGDFGIEAVEGVTDGGGNQARRNGNPAQCLNVDCSTSGG